MREFRKKFESLKAKQANYKKQKVNFEKPIEQLSNLENINEVQQLLQSREHVQLGNEMTLENMIHNFESVKMNKKLTITINDVTKLNPKTDLTEEETTKLGEISTKLKEIETKLFSENITNRDDVHLADDKNVPFCTKVEYLRKFYKELQPDETSTKDLDNICH
jgi:hypothetical protein